MMELTNGRIRVLTNQRTDNLERIQDVVLDATADGRLFRLMTPIPGWLSCHVDSREGPAVIVTAPGEKELRLVILPADRQRFRWDMVESIRFAPDNRKDAPLQPRVAVRPWLFFKGRSPSQARAEFRQRRELIEPLRRMERLFSQGHVVLYVPNEQTVAAARLIAIRTEAIELLAASTKPSNPK